MAYHPWYQVKNWGLLSTEETKGWLPESSIIANLCKVGENPTPIVYFVVHKIVIYYDFMYMNIEYTV